MVTVCFRFFSGKENFARHWRQFPVRATNGHHGTIGLRQEHVTQRTRRILVSTSNKNVLINVVRDV